ncbi:MAG: M48 family metalloprotease [Verrucomicrobiales bacterium]|nr:M48 family metalloprotease [Verrucomicrobiales bacterium]
MEYESSVLRRVERVKQRLDSVRLPGARNLDVVIPWLETETAFTAPGGTIYVSRRLFERFRSDEELAFVIAHEMAHHDLGHLELREFSGWLNRIPANVSFGTDLISRELCSLTRRSRFECEADETALRLCMAAGYDPARCISIFDLLDRIDLTAFSKDDWAFRAGLELEEEKETDLKADHRGHSEWHREVRAYPSIRARKHRLRSLLSG